MNSPYNKNWNKNCIESSHKRGLLKFLHIAHIQHAMFSDAFNGFTCQTIKRFIQKFYGFVHYMSKKKKIWISKIKRLNKKKSLNNPPKNLKIYLLILFLFIPLEFTWKFKLSYLLTCEVHFFFLYYEKCIERRFQLNLNYDSGRPFS